LALGALVDMLTQGQRAAHRQLGQHVLDLRRGLIAVPIQKAWRVLPQQVDHAEGRSGPACFGPWPGGGFAEDSAWPALDDGWVGSAQRGH
jgi:hypothetical protein